MPCHGDVKSVIVPFSSERQTIHLVIASPQGQRWTLHWRPPWRLMRTRPSSPRWLCPQEPVGMAPSPAGPWSRCARSFNATSTASPIPLGEMSVVPVGGILKRGLAFRVHPLYLSRIQTLRPAKQCEEVKCVENRDKFCDDVKAQHREAEVVQPVVPVLI